MRTLVIETATAACSVALIEDGRVVAATHDVVGRGHAERLLPMIADLPGQGRADRILVDVGPGSFTGVRVGIAAARGLAIGWGCAVAGYSSLASIAAATLSGEAPGDPLAVVLEGGHGEVFVQSFGPLPELAAGPLLSLKPDAAREQLAGMRAVGDGLRFLESDDPRAAPRGLLPDAAHAVALPPAHAALEAKPIYGRAPDARTLAERGLA